jgi:hypothetical protein
MPCRYIQPQWNSPCAAPSGSSHCALCAYAVTTSFSSAVPFNAARPKNDGRRLGAAGSPAGAAKGSGAACFFSFFSFFPASPFTVVLTGDAARAVDFARVGDAAAADAGRAAARPGAAEAGRAGLPAAFVADDGVRAEAGRAGAFVTGALADDGARCGDAAAVLAALAARPAVGVAGFAGDAPRALAFTGAAGAFAFFAAGFVPLTTDFDFSATALMGDRHKPAKQTWRLRNSVADKRAIHTYRAPMSPALIRAPVRVLDHNTKPL